MTEKRCQCPDFRCLELTPGKVHKYEFKTGKGQVEESSINKCQLGLLAIACSICDSDDMACSASPKGRTLIKIGGCRRSEAMPQKIEECVVFKERAPTSPASVEYKRIF